MVIESTTETKCLLVRFSQFFKCSVQLSPHLGKVRAPFAFAFIHIRVPSDLDHY